MSLAEPFNILTLTSDLILVLDETYAIKQFYIKEEINSGLRESDFLPDVSLNKSGIPVDVQFKIIASIQEIDETKPKVEFDFEIKHQGKITHFEGVVSQYLSPQTQEKVYVVVGKDVSQSIEKEKSIFELARVASKTQDLVILTNASGKITWANPAVQNLVGSQSESLIGKPIKEIFSTKKDEEIAEQAISTALKEKKPAQAQLSFVGGDSLQKDKWIDFQIDPVFDEVGLFSHFAWIGRDLTQRIDWENQLLRTKELLLETNRVAEIGGWWFDVKTGEVYWSEVTKEIHEVPPDFEPTVNGVIEFYKEGPYRQKYFECGLNALQFGISYDEEFQIITAKGNEVWVRTIGKVEMQDGNVSRLYGTFQKIDRFKKAENEVRAAGNLLKKITEMVPGVLYQYKMSNDGSITFPFISEGKIEIRGFSAEAVKGNPNLIFEMIHPEDVERVKQAIFESYQNLSLWEQDYRVIDSNGGLVRVKAISRPEKVDDGVVWHGFFQVVENG